MPHRELDFDRVMSLTVAERAYMAGFFDGEGHVSMYVYNGKGIGCNLGISQKRIAILSWFHEVFGGSLFIRNKDDEGGINDGTRTLGVWSIGDRATIRMFFQIVKPYLRVKHEELSAVVTVLSNPDATVEEAENVIQFVRSIRAEMDRPLAVGE